MPRWPAPPDLAADFRLGRAAPVGRSGRKRLVASAAYLRLVFIDSDHLDDLDGLFDIVKVRTGRLVVYLTADTLRRPWCVGEVTTAFHAKVHMLDAPASLYCLGLPTQLDFAAGVSR